MLELPAHSIPHHCAADLTTDHEARSRSAKGAVRALDMARFDVRVSECKVDHKPPTSRPPTRPHGCGEVRALAQPGRGRKHGVRDSGRRQAERP
jgi:hypothetical protein